ncbi:hypothetical protein GO013_03730 [Pseudodesulfovibrio sp. JC047]|uniref:hypothetical protein n=1 Tax=Pseudodesulfovibrio sp. JC047 TaxID=2683199 RepID=UPI0013D1FC30|nr:hypothetical protein [Pseudodesulfovibrio sp. JC047]NDV18528.1 hypothetical protein [Pseudodesulfovibrio sp. JC047]
MKILDGDVTLGLPLRPCRLASPAPLRRWIRLDSRGVWFRLLALAALLCGRGE